MLVTKPTLKTHSKPGSYYGVGFSLSPFKIKKVFSEMRKNYVKRRSFFSVEKKLYFISIRVVNREPDPLPILLIRLGNPRSFWYVRVNYATHK